MAEPIDFPQANCTLGAPVGDEENVAPLRVFTDGKQCASVWKLTPEEVQEVLRTGEIRVNVLFAGTQPPIYVWVGPLAKGLF